ncbi:unnamed protein product, partial [Vitis vinifera]
MWVWTGVKVTIIGLVLEDIIIEGDQKKRYATGWALIVKRWVMLLSSQGDWWKEACHLVQF